MIVGGLRRRLRSYQRQNWQALAYRALRRVLAAGGGIADVQVHTVIAIPPQQLRVPARLPKGVTVREVGAADLASLSSLRPAMGRAYAARFARHHRAFGAFLQQRLVAFVWLRGGPALLPSSFGVQWQLEPGMTWVYDLHSDAQVLGAIAHLYACVREHAAGQGCRLLIGQTDLDNIRSRHTHASLGYRRCATVCSARIGKRWLHLSRWHRAGRRLQGTAARLPLHRVCQNRLWGGEAAPAVVTPASDRLDLVCGCGRVARIATRERQPRGMVFRCAAGHKVAEQEDGWLAVGPAIPYWGELPEVAMRQLLRRARSADWRTAVEESLAPALAGYVAGTERADFEAVLPVTPGCRVLDVGAGWGGIAALLAQCHDVVALEGVRERAEFIALRGQQQRLERLLVVQGDIHTAPLLPGQFDLIVANGILEWSALLDTGAPARDVQLRFLHRLHDLLAPGGMVYLAIENRYGLAALRGARDHSGLPYTSLMPRPLARWVCGHHSRYRAQANRGYRTYTYSLRGYRRLFAEAGLRTESVWFCPWGYNLPAKLVPLQSAALAFCFSAAQHGDDKPRWRSHLRQALLRTPAVRWLASDFAFTLRPRVAGAEPRPAAVPGPLSANAVP